MQKLYKSRQIRAFDGNQSSICTSGLGYYCDLQSLHSEDAITWSIFGPLCYSNLLVREKWVSQFLELLGIKKAKPTNSNIFLWRRIPHPDTLVSGGPEIDFGILTDNTLIFGEAKWMSRIGNKQGKKRDKDQIQLRLEFLDKYGKTTFPSVDIFLVVGVGLSKDAFNDSKSLIFGARLISTTWLDICSIKEHPHYNEIQRYYKWKLKHTL